MAKMRIHEIAKSLNIKSGELVKILNDNGFEVKSHNSNIEDDAISFILKHFSPKKEEMQKKTEAKPEPKREEKPVTKEEKAPVKEEAKKEVKTETKVEVKPEVKVEQKEEKPVVKEEKVLVKEETKKE